MKPYLGWILSFVLVAVLFWQWKCTTPIVDIKHEQHLLDSFHSETVNRDHFIIAERQLYRDSIGHLRDSLDYINKQKDTLTAKLSFRRQTINGLIAEVKYYADSTIAYKHAVDSLVAQIEQGIPEVVQYIDLSDSAKAKYENTIKFQASIIHLLDSTAGACNQSQFNLQLQNQQLLSDLASLQKKVKRGSRLSILIAAVLGGALILKK